MYFCVSRNLNCLRKSLLMINFESCKSVTLKRNHSVYYRNIFPSVNRVPNFNNYDSPLQVSISVIKTVERSYAKKRKVEKFDDESSDSESDIVDKFDKNCKVMTSNMTSLRLDAILKSGLGLARNKVDTAFYESKIRVNGDKVSKKSQRVNVGDEVDIVKNISPMNPDFLNVARIELMSAKADEDSEVIVVKMKRFKNLQIENYEKAPYKQEEVH